MTTAIRKTHLDGRTTTDGTQDPMRVKWSTMGTSDGITAGKGDMYLRTTASQNTVTVDYSGAIRAWQEAEKQRQAQQKQLQDLYSFSEPASLAYPDERVLKMLHELMGEVVALRKEVADLREAAGNSFAKRHTLGHDFRASSAG